MVTAVYLTFAGTAVGSFAGALAWRLHTGRSVFAGRSECERCGHVLGALDLIPVFGWILLRGRCRYCRAHIGVLPPLVELGVGGAFLASYLFRPVPHDGWAIAALVFWLICWGAVATLVVSDVRWRQLPNRLLLTVLLTGTIAAGIERRDPSGQLWSALLGVVLAAAVYAVPYLISRGTWVGLGDVKLAAVIGAVLGWRAGLIAVAAGNVLAAAVVVAGLAANRLHRGDRVPFGPYLAVAFVIIAAATT